MANVTENNYRNIPTLIVIFGATGDLSTKKLIPAIFDLYNKEMLPAPFKVVGFSRAPRSDTDFRAFARSAIEAKGNKISDTHIKKFLEHFHYHGGLFEDPEAYLSLGEHSMELDKKFGGCSNKLFYLAVPPVSYEPILRNLADSGLTIPCSRKEGWTRVLLEKPFGNDIETAIKLDKMLGLLFREEQIFRIDHYLAKETIQDILLFRFSNVMFEPTWNNKYIEKVEIKLFETAGIEGRGAFYDGIGSLRDVGQNHILQMLAAIAMENPGELASDPIRGKRAEVLHSLVPIKKSDIPKQVIRGQYKEYAKMKGVASRSKTETYFKIEAHIGNDRWRGVPFFLESGKKMGERKTEVSVYFKKTESCLCPPEAEQHHQNVLTFRIQPDEGISVLFWAKKPGFAVMLEPKKMSFLYKQPEEETMLTDAYERVLFDCIRGDQTLFTSTDEVLAAWKFITSIIKNWEEAPLTKYDAEFLGIS